MTRHKRVHIGTTALLALALATVAGTVQARELANSADFAFFGSFTAVDATNSSAIFLDNGGGFGFDLGYHITDNLEAEFDFGYNTTTGYVGGNAIDGNVITILFSTVYNFHASDSLIPFVKVGVGYARIKADAFDTTLDDGALIGVGGGLRWFPLDNGFHVRGETLMGPVFGDETTFNIRVGLGIGYLFNFGG